MKLGMNAELLRRIEECTSAETGERFFDSLVQHLASALDTKYAWVTEWGRAARELHALSFWAKDHFVTGFRYPVAGSPCETVVDERRPVHIPDRVIELYPLDVSLQELGAVSYFGVPLLDNDGGVLGHLALLDDRPMDENPSLSAILNIFAGRASAELRRLQREREIREREAKLSRLFEGAMDAIVEFNDELCITNINSAAERTFQRLRSEAVGSPVDELLTVDSKGKLVSLVDGLMKRSGGERSIWIDGGLEGIDRDAGHFPAEATLSHYETDGHNYFALILRNVLERIEAEERVRFLLDETTYLRNEIETIYGFDEIVGNSPALRRVLDDVVSVASTDATVLITGETGTGKELIARAIHRRSSRSERPMVTVNCAAISAGLQESEFFGHEKGSFTGASQRRDGRFKLAHGGTIFLDEVGEMPIDLQAKLLRVLQEGEFTPVGSSHTVKVDVRVIAATNRDLSELADSGKFRPDLMYRLSVFPIHLPPLRERREDIPLLAEDFTNRLARRQSRNILPLSETFKRRLSSYDWPGNIRELQNVIERAFITSIDGRSLNLDKALPETRGHADDSSTSLDRAGEDRVLTATDLKQLERQNIERALSVTNGRLSGAGGAADLLGVHANTLASRIRSLGIERRAAANVPAPKSR